jgi:hypothetical protein
MYILRIIGIHIVHAVILLWLLLVIGVLQSQNPYVLSIISQDQSYPASILPFLHHLNPFVLWLPWHTLHLCQIIGRLSNEIRAHQILIVHLNLHHIEIPWVEDYRFVPFGSLTSFIACFCSLLIGADFQHDIGVLSGLYIYHLGKGVEVLLEDSIFNLNIERHFI